MKIFSTKINKKFNFFSKRFYIGIVEPPKLKEEIEIKLNELEESEKHLSKSNFQEAISYLTRGEMICTSIFGEKHKLTQNVKSKLSYCYLKQEKYGNATKILQNLKKNSPKENYLEERIFIYDNLIYSYSKQQNYKGT